MDIKAFRGLSGTYNVRANERDRGAPRNIECLVQFLNNTQHKFVIDRRSKGQCLLDSVFQHLNLFETDFFGLKYIPQQDTLNESTELLNRSDSVSDKISQHNPKHKHNNNNIGNSDCIHDSANQSTTSNTSSPSNLDKNSNNNNSLTTINAVNLANNSLNLHTSKNDFNNRIQKTITLLRDNKSSISTEDRWLDPTKSIRKQYKSGPPFKFYFRVKFYVSDPSKLADDTTRTHLYLQLRQDILNDRLTVPTCSAILLASYILQSEVGDYKRELLEEDYVSKFRLLPSQGEDIKKKIVELHKQHKSLTSADAEYQFLEHAAKKLDCYGVEFFEAIDHNKQLVQLGVSSNGIVVFRDDKKLNQFSWAKIIKIMFKKRLFSIQLRRDEGEICDNFIEFNLISNQACKSFWEECVAQHSFFRLHQPKSPPKKFFSFLNFGSKFQYNGKTEYQTMEESRKRSFSHFSRTPSKRYARRTLPIGRPSWTESTNHDNQITSEDQEDQISQVGCTTDKRTIAKIAQDTWALTPIASSSVTSSSSTNARSVEDRLQDGSVEQGSSAYKPKSLTLKSFMYIDESKSLSAHEQTDSAIVTSNLANGNHDGDRDGHNFNNEKKNFKRTESLRISNSIKEALSLTKKAGVSSSSHLAKISETLRDRFLAGKSKQRKPTQQSDKAELSEVSDDSDDQDDQDLDRDMNTKIVNLTPGPDGKYGFKIREIKLANSQKKDKKSKKVKDRSIVIFDVSPKSPAATCDPRLHEGDQLIAINGVSIAGLSESKVENLIKSIQQKRPPNLVLEINPRHSVDCSSIDSSSSQSEDNSNLFQVSVASSKSSKTLASSIRQIKKNLANKSLIDEFEKLSRKKEDESHDESRMSENIDKNRYQDILPYDSTRVQLLDSMSGDYINASFVDMSVPHGVVNRYIATQGPLSSTCDDFWQMVWEQNCSLIIMVTPLIEGGRVKCHKYWPDEREETRYGQISVRNLSEKPKTAIIERSIQLHDVKSGEKRITTQIQYKAWPDHEVPEDCSDFLKLVNRVKKHRLQKPNDPIIVHCSAGIGRTGVLILMETAICTMEAGQPIYPIQILTEMRKQRAMLIQTSSQFQFVAEAICRVYDQKLYSKCRKRRKK